MQPYSEDPNQANSLSDGLEKIQSTKSNQTSMPGNSLQSSKAKKFDQGKPRLSLLPTHAIMEAAGVMTFGAQKYGDKNWMQGDMRVTRLWDAAVRHMVAFFHGEDTDPESGKSHLAHAICNMSMIHEIIRIGCGQDDR